MYYRTQQIVLATTVLDAMLAALSTRPALALLATPTVDLYTNVHQPIPTDVMTAFTKATFHGYVAQVITLSAGDNLGGGDQGAVGSITFTATAPIGITGQSVTGYVLSDGATNFYAGEQFPQPLQIVNALDFLQIDFIFPLKVMPSFSV